MLIHLRHQLETAKCRKIVLRVALNSLTFSTFTSHNIVQLKYLFMLKRRLEIKKKTTWLRNVNCLLKLLWKKSFVSVKHKFFIS